MKDFRIKRLVRESKELSKKYKVVHDCNNHIIYIKLNLYGLNKNLKFVFPIDYPFKAPSFYINNISYINNLCIKHPYILNSLKKENIKCLCYKSNICNWCPSLKTEKLVDEFIDNYHLLIKVYYYNILVKVFEKKHIYAIELVEKIMFYV